MIKMKRTANLKIKLMCNGTGKVGNGKRLQLIKSNNTRVRHFNKSVFECII